MPRIDDSARGAIAVSEMRRSVDWDATYHPVKKNGGRPYLQ